MAKKNDFAKVTLSEKLVRGEKKFDAITLRKPYAGDLRGTKILDVIQGDVGSLLIVLPRISEPALSEADLATMDIADITAMGFEVSGFLEQKQK